MSVDTDSSENESDATHAATPSISPYKGCPIMFLLPAYGNYFVCLNFDHSVGKSQNSGPK